MKTIDLFTTCLQPNDYNSNEMTKAEFAELVGEIRHLGRIPKPIVARQTDSGFTIVDGEHNWKAAQDVGFIKLPCEIIDVNDFEAMRQTYKRNQHGTHNPIRLGQMFQRMMNERKFSQRALAKEMELSEGTIRNALEYTKAAKVRNDYAFDKLTVKQIRYYNRLPKLVGDVWLNCGADVLCLLELQAAKTKEKVRDIEQEHTVETVANEFKGYADPLLWECVRKRFKNNLFMPQDFIKAIKIMDSWFSYEREWTLSKLCMYSLSELRQYTKHYYRNHWALRTQELMTSILNLMADITDSRLSFVLTPDEFDAVVTEWDTTLEHKDSHHDNFISLVRLAIAKKTGKMPGKERAARNVKFEIIELELADAPDYIRNSELRSDVKHYLWKKQGPEWKKKELAQRSCYLNVDEINREMFSAEKQQAFRDEWEKASKVDLAKAIAIRIPLYPNKKGEDAGAIENLAKALTHLTKKELMFFNEYTQHVWHLKELAETLRAIGGK